MLAGQDLPPGPVTRVRRWRRRQQEDPAGGRVSSPAVMTVPSGRTRPALRSRISCHQEPVAERAFSDGPVAVVALHGDGRMSGTGVGAGVSTRCPMSWIWCPSTLFRNGDCVDGGVDHRFGDDRYRLGRSGVKRTGCTVEGDHQHTGERVGQR